MKKIIFATFCAVFFLHAFPQQIISSMFYGQSYHFTSWTNYQNPNNDKFPYPTEVFSSGARLIRIGGKQYNTAANKPTDEIGYVAIIDDIRQYGFEPVLTIPCVIPTQPSGSPQLLTTDAAYTTAVATAVQNAKEIIRLVNIVHKRNVTRVIIANEPGIDYGIYDYGNSNPADAADALFIATYVKALSQAVREADPSTVFQIIGPELEFNIKDLTDYFFDSNNPNDPKYLGGYIPVGSTAQVSHIWIFTAFTRISVIVLL